MVQKKKSNEQDVLVVRDEKTGEISAETAPRSECPPRRRTRPTSCVLTATAT